jgi:hypothetical protein
MGFTLCGTESPVATTTRAHAVLPASPFWDFIHRQPSRKPPAGSLATRVTSVSCWMRSPPSSAQNYRWATVGALSN